MAIYFAIPIDLEVIGEEAFVGGLVVVESVGVLCPGTDFEGDAVCCKRYKGGFMISFLMGLMNRFFGICIILLTLTLTIIYYQYALHM